MNIRVVILLAFASSSIRCIGHGDGTTIAIGSLVDDDGGWEDIPTHVTRARRGMKYELILIRAK